MIYTQLLIGSKKWNQPPTTAAPMVGLRRPNSSITTTISTGGKYEVQWPLEQREYLLCTGFDFIFILFTHYMYKCLHAVQSV